MVSGDRLWIECKAYFNRFVRPYLQRSAFGHFSGRPGRLDADDPRRLLRQVCRRRHVRRRNHWGWSGGDGGFRRSTKTDRKSQEAVVGVYTEKWGNWNFAHITYRIPRLVVHVGWVNLVVHGETMTEGGIVSSVKRANPTNMTKQMRLHQLDSEYSQISTSHTGLRWERKSHFVLLENGHSDVFKKETCSLTIFNMKSVIGLPDRVSKSRASMPINEATASRMGWSQVTLANKGVKIPLKMRKKATLCSMVRIKDDW